MYTRDPKIINGPKGIGVDKFLDLVTKVGATYDNAIIDEKKITIGTLTHPNQNPIADKSLASPNPIPSLFLIFLYKNIIVHIIKYPTTPPIKEFTKFGNNSMSKPG